MTTEQSSTTEADGPDIEIPRFALRGWEIARLVMNADGKSASWVQVAHFRDTELALRQAAAECKWLQWRHPEDVYELRALVSITRNAPEDNTAQPAAKPANAEETHGAAVTEVNDTKSETLQQVG